MTAIRNADALPEGDVNIVNIKSTERDSLKKRSSFETFSRLFTLLVVVYPIFNRYQSVVPLLTISEFALLLLFIVSVFRFRVFTMNIDWIAFIFAMYLLFDITLHTEMLSGSDWAQGAGTAGRLALLYLLFAFMGKNFMDFDYGFRALIYVSVIVAVYGLVQTTASRIGVVLTTYIPGLPIMGVDNLDVAVRAKMDFGLTFRMQSVLNEPAALCCYLILPITMLLNGQREIEHANAVAVFLSAVCVLSLSSTGIIVVLVLWGCYVGRRFVERSIDARILLLGLMTAIVVIALVVAFTDIWSYFVSRTFGKGLSGGTRFYALDIALTTGDTPLNVLFGILTPRSEDYLPGFARTYYLYGLCGLVLITLFMLSIVKRGDKLSRWIVAVFILLNVGTEIMLGNFAIYYLCFASSETNRNICTEGQS